MKRTKKSKKGFTLIELIVVVAILAILAAIAVPNFIGMTNKARIATEVADASELANAINIHNTIEQGQASASMNLITNTSGLTAATLAEHNLAPSLSNGYVAAVLGRITITNNIATVTDKD